ncbi:hypothetical protein BS47DRAFT_619910 [Hydnum rufescens UP504]|uniref:PAN2-PAN3 deadenylation complex subunit PAN3 n=1 Tax=Hydnum rufescens UP504 TaxID=1448309 RepID=A0A9P6B2Q6_9AGAM|nr:hypothetical protein BS47DRAFT_619910 [Hydnum rufescens UP504]
MNNIELDPSQPSTYLANEVQTQLYAQAGYLDTQEYYHTPPTFVRQPLNYHLYTQLPYLPYGSASQSKPPSHRFFMSDTLREDLQRRSEAIYSLTPRYPSNEKPLPEELHVYHSLVPLEPSGPGSGTSSPGGSAYLASAGGFYPHPSGSGGGDGKDGRDSREQLRRKWFAGFSSMVYKATNREDGSLVVLRRIEGFRLMQESAFGGIEAWRKIKHPNIVSLREAFTTRAFGDHSLVFAYDYHPTAQTLYNLHFASDAHPSGASRPPRNARYGRGGHAQRDSGSNGSVQNHVEESIMWSYVIQIANAMKEVHDQGLALRSLDVTKVLVTGKNRVRINCCGIFDVLSYDPRHVNIEALQQDDLINFGRLVFALCCHSVAPVTNLTKALEVLSRHYSPDMKNVALFLISKPAPGKVIDQLLEMFGTRLLTEMNALQNYADQLEGELMSELENGRLVRLMSKMGFINERPDFNHELRWSETGDRYIISLFRDYVFHQVDETQKPVVNITHVIACLNKLDTGSDERIMLVSRDEQTCLVVSYKEIKACIDSAFSELARPDCQGFCDDHSCLRGDF